MTGPSPTARARLVLLTAAALSAFLLLNSLPGTRAGDKKDKDKAVVGKKDDKAKKDEKKDDKGKKDEKAKKDDKGKKDDKAAKDDKGKKEIPPEPKKIKRVRAKPTRELKGHTGFVTRVVYTADGKRLISSSRDRTVRIWDPETGKAILVLKDYKQEIRSVDVSPDGGRVATPTGAFDKKKQTFVGEIRIRETDKGKDVLTLKGHTGIIESVAYSGDGKLLASGSEDKTAKLWDASGGKELQTFKGHTDDVLSVALSADGKKLVTGSKDKTVKVWDTDTGKDLLTLKGQGREVTCVALSPDGSRVAAGSLDGTVKIWDMAGKEVHTLKEGEGVWTVAYTRDGKRLAAAGYAETIKIWDAETGKDERDIVAHDRSVTTIAFSPDGQKLASGGVDQVIRIWDLNALKASKK